MFKRHFFILVPIFAVLLLFSLFELIDSSKAQQTITSNIIVFHNPLSTTKRNRLLDRIQSFGGRVKYRYHIIDAVAVRGFPSRSFESLRRDPDIFGFSSDGEVHAHLSESLDIIFDQMGDVVHNDMGIKGDGVVVCVLDTGVDCNHPDLSGNCVEGRDFVNTDDDPSDGNGHGTHVAGIVRGVAPGVLLKVAQVLNSSGSGSFSDVIAGIEWCMNMGQFADPSDHLAKVINMSLGGGSFTGACDGDTAAIASNNAVDEGAVVVSSSGNAGTTNAMGTPACASEVIAVGATYDFDGTISSCCQSFFGFCFSTCSESVSVDQVTPFSNGGTELDVTAPGDSITSTCPGNSYCDKSGTSMSAPHVAGLAALIVGEGPNLSPTNIRQIIRDTSLDLGPAEFDDSYGYGRIDAIYALDHQLLAGPSCVDNIECDDGNACTVDSCDSGSCVNNPVADGTSCDDGDACTESDQCSGGVCGGAGPDCDDGNVCTADSCVSGTGCVNDAAAANGASCNDGDLCTTNDQCSAGNCIGGAGPDCDDGNVCTADSCVSGTGCVNDAAAANGTSCNDGNLCSTIDECSSGSCVGTAPLICDDNDACTTDSCNPGTGCVHEDTCSTTVCGDGVCEGSSAGEDCTTCPADCPGGFFGTCCGDGVCGFFESFGSGCPVDC